MLSSRRRHSCGSPQADLQSEPSTRPSADGDVHSLLSAAVEEALFRPSSDGDAVGA